MVNFLVLFITKNKIKNAQVFYVYKTINSFKHLLLTFMLLYNFYVNQKLILDDLNY